MSRLAVRKYLTHHHLYVAVFLIAFLNALVCSILTPAFQVPDETAHFAYVQRLAESGVRAGGKDRPEYSAEQSEVMRALGTRRIIGRPALKAPVTPAAAEAARSAVSKAERDAARENGGGSSTASSQPPLYYALAAIPYRLTSWFSLTTRLHAIRIMSAFFFAISALSCALLIRQVLRGPDTLALVGGLSIGLSPYVAFISAGVSPDGLLLLESTLLALVLGRCAIEGPSQRGVIFAAVLVGCGVTTKLTFLALVPGAIVGLVLALVKLRRSVNFVSTCILTVVGVASFPLVFLVWLRITGEPLVPALTGTATLDPSEITAANFHESLSYGWQLYAPRLPFMSDQFMNDPPIDLWLNGFAGRYGWLDYSAPAWLGTWFSRVILAAAGLALLEAIRRRKVVWRHRVTIAIAVLGAGGLLAVIAKSGYDYRRSTGFMFEQPRYLFPLASLYAITVATACRAVGPRLRPAFASVLVALLSLHAYSGWVLTVARYYG